MSFKVAVIGQGAREQALAIKLQSSSLTPEVWVAPGHPQSRSQFLSIDSPMHGLADRLASESFDLVVVGPEAPLAEGLADDLACRGISCFGPVKHAARLESSKIFAKDMMARAGIPTADFEVCQDFFQLEARALARCRDRGSVVIKADGLAGGKGVFVCHTESDVRSAVQRLGQDMAKAAHHVVLEDCLVGREVSFFYLVRHHQPVFLGTAVDYKRLLDKDQGPNTGGMGCYTPVPWLPVDAENLVRSRILDPLMKQLTREKIEYHGFLYVGIMWTNAGPAVVEFNCRLGDPEAQVLTLSDPRDWLRMILGHEVEEYPSRVAVATVLASGDYPYGEGEKVEHRLMVDTTDENLKIFAAAIAEGKDGSIVTKSGRVLTVVGVADTHAEARRLSLERTAALQLAMPTLQYRKDIAVHVD